MTETPSMRELPAEDRPREKLLRLGAAALTTPELFAILLRTGVKGCHVGELARRLVEAFGGAEAMPCLRTHDVESLRAFVRTRPALRGIGEDKLATLLAAFELGARIFNPPPRALRKPLLRAVQVAELMFAESSRYAREGFWALYLNCRRVLMRPPELITLGVEAQALISAQALFRRAVMMDAQALILVHNHPSGDVSPSAADVETTEALVAAGRTLGISVLDHVIVGRPEIAPSFCSLRDTRRCVF